MSDRQPHSLPRHLLLLMLTAALGPIHAADRTEPAHRASFQTIPGALPAVLDEDRQADGKGLSQMSDQALQAALRARRTYFEHQGLVDDAAGGLDPARYQSKAPISRGLADPGLASDLLAAGLTSIGGTADEPTGEVTLPVDPSQSCPGFYILRTHPGVNSQAGRVGAEVLLAGTGLRTLQGGLNFGGQATSSIRGFAAFSIANANKEEQVVNIGLDAQAPGRIILQRRKGEERITFIDQAVSAGQSDISATVPPGFYVISYEPNRSKPTNYTVAALTSFPDRPGGGFQGGVVFGGYHNPARESTGFGGFCIAEPFDVTVKVLSSSYGSSGARGLAFSMSSGSGDVYLDSRVQTDFEIAIQQQQTFAYQPVAINVTGDRPLDTLSWQIDISGSTAFNAEDTLQGPLLIEDGDGFFVPPPVFLFQPQAQQPTYQIRLLADDGAVSTTASLQQQRPDQSDLSPGIASTALQLIMKAIYTELDDPMLAAATGEIQPGVTLDLIQDLDGSLTLIDEHAVALLGATFAGTSSSAVAKFASKQSVFGLSGYSQTFDCLSDQIDLSGSHAERAEDCWSVAMSDVRNNIQSITDLTERFSLRLSGMASLLRRPGRLAGDYIQRIKINSAVTSQVNEYAQPALRLPPFEDDPEVFSDYVAGKLTTWGQQRLYDQLTAGWNEFDQQLPALIDQDAALSVIEGLSQQGGNALRALEDGIFSTSETANLIEQSPEAFGGPDSPGIDDPNVPPIGEGQTAEQICQENPDFNATAQYMGFSSCEEYVAPFLDEIFLRNSIMHPLQQLSEIGDAMEENGCFDVDTFETPICESLLESYQQWLDELTAVLKSYSAEGCQEGYDEFDTGESSTCVWNSLIAAMSGSCPSGSRKPPYSTGSTSICTYFSRDYIRQGECLANYEPVYWPPLDAMTCRWADLPIASPAAYTVDKQSRARRTLVR